MTWRVLTCVHVPVVGLFPTADTRAFGVMRFLCYHITDNARDILFGDREDAIVLLALELKIDEAGATLRSRQMRRLRPRPLAHVPDPSYLG